MICKLQQTKPRYSPSAQPERLAGISTFLSLKSFQRWWTVPIAWMHHLEPVAASTKTLSKSTCRLWIWSLKIRTSLWETSRCRLKILTIIYRRLTRNNLGNIWTGVRRKQASRQVADHLERAHKEGRRGNTRRLSKASLGSRLSMRKQPQRSPTHNTNSSNFQHARRARDSWPGLSTSCCGATLWSSKSSAISNPILIFCRKLMLWDTKQQPKLKEPRPCSQLDAIQH